MTIGAMKVTVEMSDDKIKGLLCSAFEGGSNYWYLIEEEVLAPGFTSADFRDGGKMQTSEDYWHPCQLIPLAPGCFLIIRAPEESLGARLDTTLDAMLPAVLDRKAIERGLQVMARDCPQHFADTMNESGDATTGDVFLQCCLYGEIIFG